MSTPSPRHWSAVPLALLIGCAPDDSAPAASVADGCILDTADACDDCLEIEHVVQLGSVAGPGYLSGEAGGNQVVRDGSGRYWIGDGGFMNVYGPGGEFIQAVGREGEGPMEFQWANPFHADADGNVHVWDPRNLRVTIVSQDFEPVDEVPLTAQWEPNDMMALDDGDLYVMQAWSGDVGNSGQPLHIVDGEEVLVSFGEEYGPGDDRSAFNELDLRYAASAPDGSIMVAHGDEYRVEVWSRDGILLATLTGPDLENPPGQHGPITPENPLPSKLQDMHVDATGRAWISLLLRRPDWVENSEEDPQLGLMPVGMDVRNWFRGRIDVVDVATCTLLASHDQDDLAMDFVEDGLVADVVYSPEGAPLINVKRVRLRSEADTSG